MVILMVVVILVVMVLVMVLLVVVKCQCLDSYRTVEHSSSLFAELSTDM